MCNYEGDFWYVFVKEGCDIIEIGNVWYDKESLVVVVFFVQQGFVNGYCIKWGDIGFDGEMIDWGCCDDGQILDVSQCQLQSMWDWGCCQCEDMDIGVQGFECFFVFDVEILFFVDDQQVQIIEFYGFGQECMCFDDDFYFVIV